jgi:putative transposase
VDLGIKALATLSDCTTVEGPKALRRYLKKLQRLSRAHSRKKKGSANRRKSSAALLLRQEHTQSLRERQNLENRTPVRE